MANHAGAAPKMMPVRSASPNANARTRRDGRVLMGRNWELRKCQRQQQPRGGACHDEPGDAARHREQDAFRQRLHHDLTPGGAERQAHGGLATPRYRAGEQQVRDVRARDQQHEPAHCEQNLQAASVLFFHHADAGAGRNDVDHLLRKHADDIGHPVRGISGVVLQPLPQHAGQTRAHTGRGGPRAATGRSRATTPRPTDAAARRRR